MKDNRISGDQNLIQSCLLVFIRVNSWLRLIWKNKANFQRSQVDAKSVITKRYEKNIGLDTWWKQTQFYLAPRFIWGLRILSEKTKPICSQTNRRKLLCERTLWQNAHLLDAKKQSQTNPICSFRVRCTVCLREFCLKKQSQFVMGQMNTSVYGTIDYEILCIFMLRKNKANQSQSAASNSKQRSWNCRIVQYNC